MRAAAKPTDCGGAQQLPRYLLRELEILSSVRAVLCLGRVAFDAYLKAAAAMGVTPREAKPVFAHGATFEMTDGRTLITRVPPQPAKHPDRTTH